MTPETDWDKVLNEVFDEINKRVEFNEGVKNTRIKSGISLLELSEITGVSESDLETFESGREIDGKNKLKVLMWFFKKEGESIVYEEDLRQKFRLAYLLCKLCLYGNEKQWGKFSKFIDSFKKKNQQQ